MARTSERIGKSGEYMTAALLSLESDTVSIIPHGSTSANISKHTGRKYDKGWQFDLRRGKAVKDRKYKDGSIDLYALYCVPHQTIIFLPATRKFTKITFTDEEMQTVDSHKSFKEAMSQIKKPTN
jgi:hypothetical protein